MSDPASSVVLRDVTEADLPIFFEFQLDPEASQMAAFPSRERDAFMAHWRKLLVNSTITKQTILYNGKVAGDIGSWEQDGQTEVSYWIGKPYWGQGLASAALAALLDRVKTRPLYAHVVKHNHGSLRVLQKNGFTIIGEEIAEDGIIECTLRLDASA
ncbi:MAG: GNAT family N-acetyltransferase [Chloroflexi bacterium]|nr:GNAT family N-acetyltransferase [Chloroflexota bacterium]